MHLLLLGAAFALSAAHTRDPVDAVYGGAGTLLAFAWLWVLRRFGMKALPAAPT